MNSLEGQWGSRRRRRKFVDASMFGDHLPRGWKLLLGLKRKERVAWINCRRYVSPKGHQFATCKEVASYLMSVLGYPEAKLTAIHSNSATVHGSNAVHFVDLQQQTDPTVEKQIAMPVTSVTLFNHSGDSHQQKLQKDETPVGVSVRRVPEMQNIHENDISNKLENPSKDSSQIFNRPDETCSIPVSPTAYGPDESKCTDDPVGCTDATQSKQVSEPCDLLHGNFGSSREENNLNNQLESKPFSVTLDERDLNSVEMEVDGASI
ncbi:hypothetical protein PR202_gb22343 [Eleusine coracana subsp. coracana]|uniref:MBD domain-containing protein n=1 Tax=Eleusine coracana subsp. coracana TaxID=191504 RepID=A0AAV5FHG5_ELECO|nr:hypothetical protein PR202_gb22343 [Eleusine coracana subsp. coracana]